MLLTKTFSPEQFGDALDSWTFVDLSDKEPVLCSLFGDVLLGDRDGAYWFLSSLDGSLTRPFDNREHCQRALDTEDGQDEYLLGGLAIAAHNAGLELGRDEVYNFVKPPILGGGFEVDNVTTMDFVVAINLSGQLIGQVRDLPPGSSISGVTLSEDLDAPTDKRPDKKRRGFFRR